MRFDEGGRDLASARVMIQVMIREVRVSISVRVRVMRTARIGDRGARGPELGLDHLSHRGRCVLGVEVGLSLGFMLGLGRVTPKPASQHGPKRQP